MWDNYPGDRESDEEGDQEYIDRIRSIFGNNRSGNETYARLMLDIEQQTEMQSEMRGRETRYGIGYNETLLDDLIRDIKNRTGDIKKEDE
jgi:hypothetical protein